ncbi:hypothetical protein [Paenibacillus medicaginis]|uniref:Uncharacterized protein n=1 Tax=Paenibacillus medicaginis TaxID=1470560 RepID=A0ABV5BZ63_9BACL
MNKKRIFFIGLLFLILIIGMVIITMFATTISPKNIAIQKSTITNEAITIKGEIIDSGNRFKGFETSYKNGSLYISVRGSIMPGLKSSGTFNLSFKNEYGPIDKVYLQGSEPADTVQVWPK